MIDWTFSWIGWLCFYVVTNHLDFEKFDGNQLLNLNCNDWVICMWWMMFFSVGGSLSQGIHLYNILWMLDTCDGWCSSP